MGGPGSRSLQHELLKRYGTKSQKLAPKAENKPRTTGINRPWFEFLAHLLPVALVGLAAYQIPSEVMNSTVSGIPYKNFVVLVALFVPWISQLACLPLYSRLGVDLYNDKETKIERVILTYAPGVWGASSFVVGSFILGMAMAQKWNVGLTMALSASCLLHILFALLMTYGPMTKRWAPWVFAWISYASAIAIAPEAYLLPPLMGAAVMLHHLLWQNKGFSKFKLDPSMSKVMLSGLILGLFLWFDKLVLYVFGAKDSSLFEVNTVFSSLIPTILTLNFYYIYKAPSLEKKLNELINSMGSNNIRTFMSKEEKLHRYVMNLFFQVIVLHFICSVVFGFLIYSLLDVNIKQMIFHYSVALGLGCSSVIFNGLLPIKEERTIAWFGGIYLVGTVILTKLGALSWLSIFVMVLLGALVVVSGHLWKTPHQAVLGGRQ